ncbi:HD domain-containing protein [Candidatus Tisiphia endosymbiont of Nemotelus uliginosus]|uniref:HD domain-containing protein n=1 Tax=Candidatus Tisiphia endosymbiont of Nemotelus uliginosus TaxID=3077926 RepID=UPI0035C8D4D6
MLTTTIVKLNAKKFQEALDYIIARGNYSVYLLEIAEILLEIHPNTSTLIAGLLSTTLMTENLSNTTFQIQEISNNFGQEIANIVEVVIKLSTINYLPYNNTHTQKFCTLLLSMVEKRGVEVLFIKLSYLLHNISVFNLTPSPKRHITAILEIMEIYIPLMEKIQLKEIADELQEICLILVQPGSKEYILRRLYTIFGKDVKASVYKTIYVLHNNLRVGGIKAKIFGKIKISYSIWLKMLQKNIDIKQLYDILAFRIIVNDLEQCYKAVEIIYHQYPVVIEQLQDYIRFPKPNGYQSLHTVVAGPEQKNIEIQIRAPSMCEYIQHGAGSHYQYQRK